MKKSLGWLGLSVSLISMSAQAEDLNLRQCITIALNQNPELMASQARIDQALAAISQSKSSYLPKVTTSITASRTNDPLNVFGMKLMQQNATFNDFGAGEFNPANPNVLSVKPYNLNHPTDYTNINTRLQAEMPVYSGGQIDAYVRQAQAYLSAAQAGDVAARQQLTFMVFQAFNGVSMAEAYMEVAAQGVEAAESFVRTAENLTAQGVMVKSELLTAKVHLSNVRLQKEQADNQRAIALEQLKMLMGKSLDSQIELSKGSGIANCDCADLAKIKEKALAHNPRLLALKSQTTSMGAAVDVASAAYLPTVGLMARQDWNDDKLSLNNNSYLVAGVLSWTVSDFGVTKGSVDRAKATHAEYLAKIKSAEQETEFKVSESYRKLAESQNRVNALELNAVQADEAARLIRQRHEGGVATITEVLVAETQLLKAKADLITARNEVNTQRGQLRLLVGELDEQLF